MRRVLAVFICVSSVCCPSEPSSSQYVVLPSDRPHLSYDAAYRAGRADAQRDVARGYFAVEEFGRLPVFYDEYVRLAAKRYGIHIKVLAGCIVDEEIEDHAKGYNEISHRAIERHFRKDVLSEVAIEVQEKWEKKHSKKTYPSLQATAGRSAASVKIMKTPSLQSTLAPASGA